MASVRYLVFGDERVQVSANDRTIRLTIKSGRGDASYTAESKEEMKTIIEGLRDALHDIAWELESYSGVFRGMLEKEEPKDEPV